MVRREEARQRRPALFASQLLPLATVVAPRRNAARCAVLPAYLLPDAGVQTQPPVTRCPLKSLETSSSGDSGSKRHLQLGAAGDVSRMHFSPQTNEIGVCWVFFFKPVKGVMSASSPLVPLFHFQRPSKPSQISSSHSLT